MYEFAFISEIIRRIETHLHEALRNKITGQLAFEFINTIKGVEFKETSQLIDEVSEKPALKRVESFECLPIDDLHIDSDSEEKMAPSNEKLSFEVVKSDTSKHQYIYVHPDYLKTSSNEKKAVDIYNWIKKYIYNFYLRLMNESPMGETEAIETLKKSIQIIYYEIKSHTDDPLPFIQSANTNEINDNAKLLAKFKLFNFSGTTFQEIEQDLGLSLISKLLFFWKNPNVFQATPLSNASSKEHLYNTAINVVSSVQGWWYSSVTYFDIFEIMAKEINAIISLKNKDFSVKELTAHISIAILHAALYQSAEARGLMFRGSFEDVLRDALIALKTKYQLIKTNDEMSVGVDSHRFFNPGEVSKSVFFYQIRKIIQENWRAFKDDKNTNITIYQGWRIFDKFLDDLVKEYTNDTDFKKKIIEELTKFRNANMRFDAIYVYSQNANKPRHQEKNKLYLEKITATRVDVSWYEDESLKTYQMSIEALSELNLAFPDVTEGPFICSETDTLIKLTKICTQIAVSMRISQLNNFLDGLRGELEDYYKRFEKLGMLDETYQVQTVCGQERYFLQDISLIKMAMIIYLVTSADHYNSNKNRLFTSVSTKGRKMELANKVLNEYVENLAILLNADGETDAEKLKSAYEGLISVAAQSCLYKITSGMYPLESNVDTNKLKETLIDFLNQQLQQKSRNTLMLKRGAS